MIDRREWITGAMAALAVPAPRPMTPREYIEGLRARWLAELAKGKKTA